MTKKENFLGPPDGDAGGDAPNMILEDQHKASPSGGAKKKN